jgi:hypothetical protein
MVNRMPEPSLLGFLPNKTPHFIDFCFFHLVDLTNDLTWIDVLNGRGIDVLELILFFCNSSMTVVGLLCRTRAMSRIPLPFNVISRICCLTSGTRPW